MKKIISLLPSFFITFFCKAQYYGFETYKQTVINSKNLVEQKVLPNNNKKNFTRKERSKTKKQSINILDSILVVSNTQKEDNIISIRGKIESLFIVDLLKAQTATDKLVIEKKIDSLNTALHSLINDRSYENAIRNQKIQYEYIQDRSQLIDFLPVRNAKTAISYYQNSDTLVVAKDGIFLFEHAYLNYLSSTKKLAAYTEVLGDFIGPVRLSLGMLLLAPATKDSLVSTRKSDSEFNLKLFQDRFKSGGGNIQLNAVYPLVQLQNNKYFSFKAILSPKFCIDVPKEDTSIQRIAINTQAAFDARLQINTFSNNFIFLLCFRGLQAWGNSSFYDNMGFKNKERKSFNFNTWTFGFIAKQQLALYYTWYSGTSRAINQVGQVNNNSLTVNYQFAK